MLKLALVAVAILLAPSASAQTLMITPLMCWRKLCDNNWPGWTRPRRCQECSPTQRCGCAGAYRGARGQVG
jgi:hypothetical protein